MKIAHLMLFNFYMDDAYYQENILPRYQAKLGHEVIFYLCKIKQMVMM